MLMKALLLIVLMEGVFIYYVFVFYSHIVIVFDIVRGWEDEDIFISSTRGW